MNNADGIKKIVVRWSTLSDEAFTHLIRDVQVGRHDSWTKHIEMRCDAYNQAALVMSLITKKILGNMKITADEAQIVSRCEELGISSSSTTDNQTEEWALVKQCQELYNNRSTLIELCKKRMELLNTQS